MVFKKDITPFAKGGSVTKHRGKGSSERRPDPMGQITGRYPKPQPMPVQPARPMPFAPPMGRNEET